jgi:XTP/dITP diphosphohydrolase
MSNSILVLGTRNRKKRDELVELLDLPRLELWTLDAFESVPEIKEDGATFFENATKKAVGLARALGHFVLGEDSGLVVDALDGRPGVYSARFAGEPCDDQRNNDFLLAQLAGVPAAGRSAHYVCIAVVSDPSGLVRARAEGRCDGHIAERCRGTNGFGYDPLFIVNGLEQTFGELPPEVKRRRSHRARAIELLRPQLVELFT